MYLIPRSNQQASNKLAVLCDQNNLNEELNFFMTTVKANGYNYNLIRRALNSTSRTPKNNSKPFSIACFPCIQTIFGRLRRKLSTYDIKIIVIRPKKIFNYLPPVKNNLGIKTPRVYFVPCECGQFYTGQSGRSLDTRIKEHQRHIRLGQPYKSAVAEYSINHDHPI